ncbi:hypothetical protein NUACC21_60250 [Scytonema sp. NUACC21]
MTIWIVTTGNSDIRLKHDKNWGRFYGEVVDDLECNQFSSPIPIDPHDKEAGYTVPARVLGRVYENQSEDDYKSDLKFPLFETYQKYFTNKNKPEKIIILLTDQTQIFSEEKRIYEQCPYWQDTCTLKPILNWYLKKHFHCQLEFKSLEPQSGKGIDHWDETLSLVKQTLHELEYNPVKTVYVSHQSGTPAISSAVQFVSLAQFKKVEFLLSNKFFDDNYEQQSEPEVIESSKYWRGIQIQKAKQLVVGGFPGAAVKVLEGIDRIDENALAELHQLVNFFNLHSSGVDSNQDFEIPQATQRIVDTLDLIGFFFNQQNYIQGITLLSAAQETFLKVAILSKIALINETITLKGSSYQVSELVNWVPLGLFLNQSIHFDNVTVKQKALQTIKIPLERIGNVEEFQGTRTNSVFLHWLQNLEPKFEAWNLLKYYCNDRRNNNQDLRNQYIHNLRGMDDTNVIEYLLGYQKQPVYNIREAYKNYVKQPFLNAINLLNLPYKKENLYKKLQKIADSLV